MPTSTSVTNHHSYHQYGALNIDGVEDGIDMEFDDTIELYQKSGGSSSQKSSSTASGVTSDEVVDEVSVVANTINALLGVSLFAMPWGFQQSGIIGGTIILCVVASLSFDTARMLLVCQKYFYIRTGEAKSYPEIAASALGPAWFGIVQSTTIVSCLGGCTGYMIFFGETVGQALSMPSSDVILFATIPLILLSWVRSFRDLTLFTVFGVIALAVTVLVILYDGSTKVQRDDWQDVPFIRFDTAVNFLGPATFLFTIHYCSLAMGAETLKLKTWMSQHVSDDSSETSYSVLTTPIAWSYVISVILVAIVGIAGFIMYHDVGYVRDHSGHLLVGCEDHVCQNVILNLSPGIPRDIVGIMMSVGIILSYILILAPAREHIERIILSRYIQVSTERQDMVFRNLIRTVLVISTIVVALKAPYFGSMLGAVGGLTDAVQCFVFPPLIFLKLEGDKLSSWYRMMCRFTVVWGSFIILYTITSIALDFV